MESRTGTVGVDSRVLHRFRFFTHIWGPDWTVVNITEYESFADIAKAGERFDELWEKKYPDEDDWKAKRDEFMGEVVTYWQGHTDAIVREVPGLRK